MSKPIGVVLTLISVVAQVLAAHEDWSAWINKLEIGPPRKDTWTKITGSETFARLEWETSDNDINSYRYHVLGATHYMLGFGPENVEVWQPFPDDPFDGPVVANFRAALQTLFKDRLSEVTVCVRNVDWTGVAHLPMCRGNLTCPNLMLIGDTQVPGRVQQQVVQPLDYYFDRYRHTNMRRIADDFPSMAFYQYHFSEWMAVPYITDLRLLAFNRTTLENMNLQRPPPYRDDDSWTWEELADMACKIARKHGDGFGLKMSSDWDEDFKYAITMAQSHNAYLFKSTTNDQVTTCGLVEPGFLQVVDNFWKRIFREKCAAAGPPGVAESYWKGVSPPSADFNATIAENIDPKNPPPQFSLSRKIGEEQTEHSMNISTKGVHGPGFFFTTGIGAYKTIGKCPSPPGQRAACLPKGKYYGISSDACKEKMQEEGGDTFNFDGRICEVKLCLVSVEYTTDGGGSEVHSVLCGEIQFAHTPGKYSFLGGSGLIIPRVRSKSLHKCNRLFDWAGELQDAQDQLYFVQEFESGAVGADLAIEGRLVDKDACKKESRRKELGWEILLELMDREKPWIMQVNTKKSGRTIPPVPSMYNKSPFNSAVWLPAVQAYQRAIPFQYPGTPIPQVNDIESKKPLRISLIRAIYGNFSTREAIQDGCAIVNEIVRPCNTSQWSTDPRCKNPVDDLQGCPQGSRMTKETGVRRRQCLACEPGEFQSKRNVKLVCNPCPEGHFNGRRGATSCSPCKEGTYSQATGSQLCLPCKPGTLSNEDKTGCVTCPIGTYHDGLVCAVCPSGMTSPAKTASKNGCHIKTSLVIHNVGLCFVIIISMIILPMIIGRRVPVRDVFKQDGCAIAQMQNRHHVLAKPWWTLKVRFQDTGHPLLDSGETFKAKYKSAHALWLLDVNGQHLDLDLNASKGSMQVCVPHTVLCLGLCCIPCGLIALGLCLAGIAFADELIIGGATEVQVLPMVIPCVAVSTFLTPAVDMYYWSHGYGRTPVARRLQDFREKLRRNNPWARAVPRGPQRAVDAGHLCDFYEFFQDMIRHRNMYYIASTLLLPLTKPERLSYAELAGPKTVQWFVSHYWGMATRDFVSSLRKHAAGACLDGQDWRSVTFWICTFSNNQWKVTDELGTGGPMDSSFNLALQSPTCRGTAMVLDHTIMPFQRSWCLFEVFQTCVLKAERVDFTGLLLCTPTGVLQHGGAGVDTAAIVARGLSQISLENATASHLKDKEMIDGYVRHMPGGFAAMNRFVRDNIKVALLKARESFETDFVGLVDALDCEGNNQCEKELCFSHAIEPQHRLPKLSVTQERSIFSSVRTVARIYTSFAPMESKEDLLSLSEQVAADEVHSSEGAGGESESAYEGFAAMDSKENLPFNDDTSNEDCDVHDMV